jgi:tetratricopeptide (TPR) repeat protein
MPQDAKHWYELGCSQYDEGNFEAAERALRESVALNPEVEQTWAVLGAVCLNLNRPEEALEYAQRAYDLGATETYTIMVLARVLDALDRESEAVAAFREAIRRNSSERSLYLSLADFFAEREKWPEAADVLMDAQEAGINDAKICFQLGVVSQTLKRYDSAEHWFREAVKFDSGHMRAWCNLGAAINLGDPARIVEAGEAYHTALGLDPNDPPSNFNYGVILDRTSRTEESITYLLRAAEGDPTDPDAPHSLGIVFNNLGRTEEAITWLKESVNRRPTQMQAYKLWSEILISQKRYEEAEEVLDTAMEQDRRYPPTVCSLSYLYRISHRKNRAAEILEQSARIYPNDPYLWANLGHTQLELDETEKARAAYERCLSLNSEGPLANRVRNILADL